MSTVPDNLDRRFRAAAVAAGCLDVAWALADSPIGELLLATTPRGICRIAFDPNVDAALEQLGETFGARVLGSAGPLEPLRGELDEYFEGKRRRFDVPVDLSGLTSFQRTALGALSDVGYGMAITYGELARRVARPQAARAVGGAMHRNPVPIVVPCHRVIGADGRLTGYAGGLERKRSLLALEGVSLEPPQGATSW